MQTPHRDEMRETACVKQGAVGLGVWRCGKGHITLECARERGGEVEAGRKDLLFG